MASEATKLDILGNMHIYSKVMEVIEHHMPISHSPCRRRSKGPLLSCSILAKATVFGRFRGGLVNIKILN